MNNLGKIQTIQQRVKHYFQVYSGFLSTCFTQAMSFRIHFVLLIFMDLFFLISALASVNIIYDHVSTIGPWNREQLLFFVSVMLTIHQCHMAFVSENFWIFSSHLRMGTLDFILLKPISSIFSTYMRFIRPGSFVNILICVGAVIYYGIEVDLSGLSWLLLPFGILFGLLLASSLDMVIATSMFWMLEGVGINFLRMQLQELSRWPEFIYGAITSRILTVVVPILLIGNAPVRFLFDHSDWLPFFGLGVALILVWVVLYFFWNLGLNIYESASS